MDNERFDRLTRAFAGRRGRRGVLAGMGAAALALAGRKPAAAGYGRPLGMVCANVAQCSTIGACGWPAAVGCESDWGSDPICCVVGGEPCNADWECCGPLSCLRADDSCGAGYCGSESAAGAGDAAGAIGVDCGNGIICTGDYDTCGLGVFVPGEPECCRADGAPCDGEGQCCHHCMNGFCQALGRGGLAVLEDLNLRTGPGTEFDIIGVVPAGTIVAPLGYAENGYLLVETPGSTGWLLAAGLSGHAG
ncbi:MAG: SH3 domain-containing protein [Thermomicrobiales bacterium]